VLGPDHPETLRSMNTLMSILTDEGRLEEAQTLEEQVLATRTRVLGPDHPLTISAMGNLANILSRRGDLKRAQQLQEQARAADAQVLGPNNPQTALSAYNLGGIELREGHRDEALRLLRNSVDHGLPGWVIAGMPTDPDLAPLHGDPRFDALLAYAKSRASAGSE